MRTYLQCMVVVLVASGVNAVSTGVLAQTKKSAVCSIEIDDPAPGSSVGPSGDVSGTAKIPPNSHLWILAHKKTINAWWPQGGAETHVENGHWTVNVTYGVDTDKGNFEVAAVAVGDSTSKDLDHWVETAPARNYPPRPFPASVEGCVPTKLTLVKQ